MSAKQDNTPVEAEIDENDPSEMRTPEEREEYFREMDEPPLLMSSFTEVACDERNRVCRKI